MIEEQAFFACENLQSIIVPKSVKAVKYQVFEGCDSLHDVYYRGTEAEWQDVDLFKSNAANTNVAVYYEFDLETGDINGDSARNMMDALLLYAAVSGATELKDPYCMLADVNRDAQINMLDAAEWYKTISGV